MRAADLIGQLADPFYPRKLNALYHEFAETGVAEQLGYHSPADVAEHYPDSSGTRSSPISETRSGTCRARSRASSGSLISMRTCSSRSTRAGAWARNTAAGRPEKVCNKIADAALYRFGADSCQPSVPKPPCDALRPRYARGRFFVVGAGQIEVSGPSEPALRYAATRCPVVPLLSTADRNGILDQARSPEQDPRPGEAAREAPITKPLPGSHDIALRRWEPLQPLGVIAVSVVSSGIFLSRTRLPLSGCPPQRDGAR